MKSHTAFISRYFVVLMGITFLINPVQAQKFGHVDADFVLKKMPAYEKAQSQITESAQKWQQDIEKKFAAAEEMQTKFLAEELLLTDEMKEERKKEIQRKFAEARELQNKIFGYQGLFFTRQQELLKPVMEELNKGIEKVARKNKLQYMFSNTEGLTILYAEVRHDYTNELLEVLGLGEPKTTDPEGKPINSSPQPSGKQ